MTSIEEKWYFIKGIFYRREAVFVNYYTEIPIMIYRVERIFSVIDSRMKRCVFYMRGREKT